METLCCKMLQIAYYEHAVLSAEQMSQWQVTTESVK